MLLIENLGLVKWYLTAKLENQKDAYTDKGTYKH